MQIGHARHDFILTVDDSALFGIGQDRFKVVDRNAHRHARALIDLVGAARLKGDLRDDLLDELRNAQRHPRFRRQRCLLLHHQDLVLQRLRIVSANLDVETILERRDDAPARGVVFRVSARAKYHIDRQTNLVALYLDILLFHQVEQTDLHLLGQIGQLIDGKDAAIDAGYQSVMNSFLICEVAALGNSDWIDLANQIRDRYIGRRKLLSVAMVAADPRDLQKIALLHLQTATALANRRRWIVVDLASFDRRHILIEEQRQRSDNARLGLAAFAEEHHVMTGEHAVLDLRQHGVVVADDARHDAILVAEERQQIIAHLDSNG